MNAEEYQIAVSNHLAMAQIAEDEIAKSNPRWRKAVAATFDKSMKVVQVNKTNDGTFLYFIVSEQSGAPKEYVVADKGGQYSCSCMDFQKNSHRKGHKCKHILFVNIMASE